MITVIQPKLVVQGMETVVLHLQKNETDKRTLQDAWIKNGLIALDIKVWDYDE